ncbi:MAG TPA: PAS domain-containing protein [Terriglobales bacterium]|nr:PAS domain-containing protein [Terriglobales bacterium]
MKYANGGQGTLRAPRRWADHGGPTMKVQLEHPADEVKRLQRCINDLVSLLALPAMWSGSTPCDIVQTLLDSLLRMLDLDFVYVSLTNPVNAAPSDTVRVAPSLEHQSQQMFRPRELCTFLNRWLGDDPQKRYLQERSRIGDEEVSLVSWPLGVHREIGVIVAGSRRADFPRDTETLLLGIAANQAVIGLQQARLLSEQKRVADELDQRVAQRTTELAAANEVLRKEVAERRRAEEALAAGKRNLRLIVEGIPGFVALMTPAGEVELVNPQLVEYTGRTLEELRLWGTSDTIHSEDLPRVVEVFARSIASGSRYDFEARIRRFDGVYRWFQVRGLPVRDADGRILRWCSLLTDIDKRKRAEEALKRSEAFLAEGQRLSRMGCCCWRVETCEFTWSEELHRIFGFEPDVPVTLDLIATRVHPEDIPLLNDMVEKARGAVTDFEYEYRLLMPDNSVKYLHMIAHGIRDNDGRLEYIGAVQDVTQRQISEEALAKARSELAHVASVTSLATLTASIAHEVNQPLSGIVTNAGTCLRMLTLDPPNVDGARETARRTIRDGNRASDVITRLRALFAKKHTLAERVDLNDATREVIALSLSELQRNRVILRCELAEDLPLVTGDRVQLQQVILNLLRNASDAMNTVHDRPRELLIKTERDEADQALLSVRDAGLGFDPQSVDRLFETFYTTKHDGMGVGLYVSRSIVESHQGRLWATLNDGPGATFSFSLPRGPSGAMGADRNGDLRTPAVADTDVL